MARTGPETWDIDGRSWKIASTYYLTLPEGLQFTVEVPVAEVPATMAEAETTGWPVVRYVYEKRIYGRVRLSTPGREMPTSPERIGVSLFTSDGIHNKGMRVAFSFSEIRSRLKGGHK